MATLSRTNVMPRNGAVTLTKIPVLWWAHEGRTGRSKTIASGTAPSVAYLAGLLRRGTAFVTVESYDPE